MPSLEERRGTILLAALSLLIYLYCAFVSGSWERLPDAALLSCGGVEARRVVLDREWWRLLGGVFLHGSLWHLVANVAALWWIGGILEPRIGTLKALGIFLAGAVAGFVVSVGVHPYGLSSGASGGIFGWIGALGVELTREVRGGRAPAAPLLRGAALLALWMVLSALLLPSVDLSAHLGGLLFGAALGALWSRGFFPYALLLLLSGTALGIWLLLVYWPGRYGPGALGF